MNIDWRKVSKEEFFDSVKELNVHPEIQQGKFPYTSLWKTPIGIVGKTVGVPPNGDNQYFLPNEEENK